MNRVDFGVAAIFGALGIYLVVSASQLPPGMGRLPGPGFFPAVLGGAMIVLALGLLAACLRGGAAAVTLANRWQLAVVIALLLLYLAGWSVIPFALRTVAFVVLFLRFLGQRWRTAAAVAVALTAAVVLAFQYGLHVSLQ
ncbi:MAG: hypothetical protein GY953_41365 [bacterium]|nr:hypothetical protein [bacterium]